MDSFILDYFQWSDMKNLMQVSSVYAKNIRSYMFIQPLTAANIKRACMEDCVLYLKGRTVPLILLKSGFRALCLTRNIQGVEYVIRKIKNLYGRDRKPKSFTDIWLKYVGFLDKVSYKKYVEEVYGLRPSYIFGPYSDDKKMIAGEYVSGSDDKRNFYLIKDAIKYDNYHVFSMYINHTINDDYTIGYAASLMAVNLPLRPECKDELNDISYNNIIKISRALLMLLSALWHDDITDITSLSNGVVKCYHQDCEIIYNIIAWKWPHLTITSKPIQDINHLNVDAIKIICSVCTENDILVAFANFNDNDANMLFKDEGSIQLNILYNNRVPFHRKVPLICDIINKFSGNIDCIVSDMMDTYVYLEHNTSTTASLDRILFESTNTIPAEFTTAIYKYATPKLDTLLMNGHITAAKLILKSKYVQLTPSTISTMFNQSCRRASSEYLNYVSSLDDSLTSAIQCRYCKTSIKEHLSVNVTFA